MLSSDHEIHNMITWSSRMSAYTHRYVSNIYTTVMHSLMSYIMHSCMWLIIIISHAQQPAGQYDVHTYMHTCIQYTHGSTSTFTLFNSNSNTTQHNTKPLTHISLYITVIHCIHTYKHEDAPYLMIITCTCMYVVLPLIVLVLSYC
jgi:hypothetical protein